MLGVSLFGCATIHMSVGVSKNIAFVFWGIDMQKLDPRKID
jgi:hypothetical protein